MNSSSVCQHKISFLTTFFPPQVYLSILWWTRSRWIHLSILWWIRSRWIHLSILWWIRSRWIHQTDNSTPSLIEQNRSLSHPTCPSDDQYMNTPQLELPQAVPPSDTSSICRVREMKLLLLVNNNQWATSVPVQIILTFCEVGALS
jgi:hypothetical protein